MKLTNEHWHRVTRLAGTAMLFMSLASNFAGVALAAQEEHLLDFTEYRPQRDPEAAAGTVVFPVLDFRRPIEFSVPPLQVIVESAVVLTEIEPPRLVLSVRLRNTGAEPYRLPVSIDRSSVMQPANRGRRSLGFQAVFTGSDSEPLGIPLYALTFFGAETAAGSFLELFPGDSALFRLPVPRFFQQGRAPACGRAGG